LDRRVLALADDDWQNTINTNLFAAVRLDRGLLPGMRTPPA
jgi:NAD(P)-dependent dehydrogenase (short-subunit alcohol dehydrogenase family)